MKKTVLLIIISFLLLHGCAPITQTDLKARNIFYIGGDNGVKTALIEAGYQFVDDFDKADVFVLNGEVVNPYILNTQIRYGKGFVLIPGKNMEHYGSDMDVEALIGQPVANLMFSDNPVHLEIDEFFGKGDPVITEIDWKNAPEIRERAFLINGPGPGTPLVRVTGYNEVILDKVTDKGFYLSAYLDEQHNAQFQEWKYFNYLIYHLVERAAGAEPLTFADYSAQVR